MEDLTKQQLVLLTLFVSFVVSIATSIVTVSLLTDGTAVITQNISQVVERTIERVVENSTTTPSVQPTPTTDVAKAIEKTTPSLGRVSGEPSFASSGFLASYNNKLWLVTRAVPDGVVVTVSFGGEPIALGAPAVASTLVGLYEIPKEAASSTPALRLTASSVKTGQTVLGIGSSTGERPTATVGAVNSIATSTPAIIASTAATTENAGGPAVTLEGNLVGVVIGSDKIVPSGALRDMIDSLE